MKRIIGALFAGGLAIAALPATAQPGGQAGAAVAPASAVAATRLQVRTQHLGGATRNLEGRLTRGDAVNSHGAYFDCYSFDAQAGQAVTIGMFSGDFDAFLTLHAGGACGAELASDDDSLAGTDPAIRWEVERAGRYSIGATSLLDGETGLYGLALIIE